MNEIVDLARLDEAGFQRLYKERIEPCFARNEGERLAAVATFKQRVLMGGVVTLALMGVLALWLQELRFVIVAILGGAVITWAWAYGPLGKVSQALKRQYCAALANAMGASFQMDGFQPPAFQRIRELDLAPSFDRSHFEDLFSGAYKNSSFELYEANLQQKRRGSKNRTYYVTVFRGQLIRMHFPRDFLGVTIVRRDAGVFNAFGGGKSDGRKLERVRLVSSEFEKAFEVWSTDQVEARYLLHPVMMERLIELERGFKGKKLRCAFEGGDLLVAVEGGNLFEPGDMFKPLVDPARAKRIVDEIAGVVRVMDQVVTAQTERPAP